MDVNHNGGYFNRGYSYDMAKKMEVLQAYLLSPPKNDGGRMPLNVDHVTETAMVSTGFAHKVITEYLATGALADPKRAGVELCPIPGCIEKDTRR